MHTTAMIFKTMTFMAMIFNPKKVERADGIVRTHIETFPQQGFRHWAKKDTDSTMKYGTLNPFNLRKAEPCIQ